MKHTSWSGWEVIYSDNWTREFMQIARKRLPYSSEAAEEAMQEARQELAIKLDKLSVPPNDLNSYLRSAFRNTLEDYIRSKHGYPRPPSWIKQLGAAYERIYKLLCLETRAVEDIHSIMSNVYQYTRDFVEQVIREVRAGVVNCGSWREVVPLDIAINEVEQFSSGNDIYSRPDQILEEMDSRSVVEMILNQTGSDLGGSETMRGVLQNLAKCKLNDDERLLLRLMFTEGYKLSKAARELNLADAQARKLYAACIKRLQQCLIAAGITKI